MSPFFNSWQLFIERFGNQLIAKRKSLKLTVTNGIGEFHKPEHVVLHTHTEWLDISYHAVVFVGYTLHHAILPLFIKHNYYYNNYEENKYIFLNLFHCPNEILMVEHN